MGELVIWIQGMHHRAKSFSSPSDNKDGWTESMGIVGTAKGVGKGMFGKAAEATKMFTSPRFSSPTRKQRDLRASAETSKYLTPKSVSYPKYEEHCSVSFIEEIPLLKIRSPVGLSVSLTIGPEEGFFECSDEIPERKKVLKNILKKLQQNPNALQEPDSPFLKYDLQPNDIKLKLLHLKEVEKKLKPTISQVQAQRKDRLLVNDNRVSGKTIDTYAYDAIRNEKAGQPNADSFYAEGFSRFLLFGVADGIGWGIPSRRAAQAALLGFSTNVKAEISRRIQKTIEWDTVQIAEICKNSLNMAHIFVNGNSEAKTTFVGGAIVELSSHSSLSASLPITVPSHSYKGSSSDDETDMVVPKKQYAFVGVSVGDSLIYRYSSRREQVNELTVSDRTFGVRDAGGSLGGSEADLRNFGCHFCLLDEGDFIIAVSDGIHDNLDPEILKVPPSQLDIVAENDEWSNVPDVKKNIAKRHFKEQQLQSIITKYLNVQPITAQTMVSQIIQFVWDATEEHRSAYQRGSELQRDWDKLDPVKREEEHQQIQESLKNPAGKFDHVTCLSLKVCGI